MAPDRRGRGLVRALLAAARAARHAHVEHALLLGEVAVYAVERLP